VSARPSPLFLLERIVSASPEPLEAVPPVIYLVVKRTVTNRSGYYMTAKVRVRVPDLVATGCADQAKAKKRSESYSKPAFRSYES
jgi:hypothetical protein